MHRLLKTFSVLLFAFVAAACSSAQPPLMELPPPQNEAAEEGLQTEPARFRVLVFSRTTGFRHASIPQGIEAVRQLGQLHGFAVDATEDPAQFSSSGLSAYAAVIFMNTNGIDVLGPEEKEAFEAYIRAGGGFVGVHSAAATEYEWPWYGNLVGAYFDEHPKPQEADVLIADHLHPSTAHLPARWHRFDEWYNYRSNPRAQVHVLASLDEGSYEGGKMNYDHPIVWAHEFDGGRSWYTGLGHTEAAYEDEDFLAHLLGGIEWAAGFAEADVQASRADAYKKVVLMNRTTDPMEIAIAEDGRVFLAERAGAIKMWSPETKKTTVVGWIPVYMVIEDGLLGITLDPGFTDNGWLYVFYAPENAGPSRLSRFTLVDDSIDMKSEKVLLEVPVQRKDCCHAGGSLAFDANGNLYLSTGDNSNPYDREGSPTDEREGRKYADAQRSSANTNDLRGKILRIHPEPDGSYTIPEGNLFEADSLHRPEIYTMGHRNPFRIAIDEKTGWLYWGDVGNGDPPNARGGWGWDEFNQARGPGFFGWPYFSGDNQPYSDFDYSTGTIGEPFDAAAPVNDSPNNTGARELPPSQPALMWYTYGVSEDFPELGAGGINPMAGPVYRYKSSYGPYALPASYEGVHLIYEWMRNWVKEVRFDAEGDLLSIDPFLPGMEFIRPMDMEIGPDGALYVIEWGESFWGSNPDAQVVRVEYHGRPMPPPPPVMPRTVDPAVVRFTSPSDGSFFDFDTPINYEVTVTDQLRNPLPDQAVSIRTYTGFDTHQLRLEEQDERAGVTTITKAFTHTPDLHFVDRFAVIEGCATNRSGFEYCDRVKLQPRHKEAEHFESVKEARRVTHGSHPASERYALTALTAVQVKNGSVITYAPIDLAQVTSIKLRYKHYRSGKLQLRANAASGPLLAEIDLDAESAVEIEETQQARDVDLALQHDEAILVEGLNREVYENWRETTVSIPETAGKSLVLVFEGEGNEMMLEMDWLTFETR